jgi:hypothetical protein
MIANRSIGVVAIGIAAWLMSTTAASAQDRAAGVPPVGDDAGRWGPLRGRVVFGGEPPAPVVLINPEGSSVPPNRGKGGAMVVPPPVRVRDHEVVGGAGPIVSERLLVDPETRGVRDAIVYLARPTAVRESARQARKAKPVSFRAVRGVFVPHVLALMSGAEVVVETDDPIAHNLRVMIPGAEFVVTADGSTEEYARPHTYRGSLNYMFGAGRGRKSTLHVRVTAGEMHPARVAEDIHPWMSAYWLILDHPYFAVTDERGNFEIPDVPTGPQEVVVWHEALGAEGNARLRAKAVFRGEVPIAVDGPTTRDFTFDPGLVAPRR